MPPSTLPESCVEQRTARVEITYDNSTVRANIALDYAELHELIDQLPRSTFAHLWIEIAPDLSVAWAGTPTQTVDDICERFNTAWWRSRSQIPLHDIHGLPPERGT